MTDLVGSMPGSIARRGQCRRPLWETLALYARTLAYLQPKQIAARCLPRPRIRTVRPVPRVRPLTGTWLRPVARSCPQLGPHRFRFLNEERDITSWGDAGASRLWLYNLHYFEYVDEPLLLRWIAENPTGQGIGWEPYPTSLRISNWCKWLLCGHQTTDVIAESLAVQADWIYQRPEYHLLANHLLANAKALLFAGTVLSGAHADRWRRLGASILEHELPRQILADGGHIERSPMYHSIVLEDVLDLCNLRRAFGDFVPDVSAFGARMLGWLRQMIHPDGGLSFFNDAAMGVAPAYRDLSDYSKRLAIEEVVLPLRQSGYVRLEKADCVLLFDAAELGPDWQPGHGHADTLSFELSCRGRRMLVNSGTSTYDPGVVRDYERGTSAHNTLRVDGCDQSEMWASFRVGRRARPLDVRTDHACFVEASHTGYRRLRRPVMHRRRVEFDGDALAIIDSVEGRGEHLVEIYFHVAPGENPVIHLDPTMQHSRIESLHSPGFNLRVPNHTAVGWWRGELPARFVTRLEPGSVAACSWTTERNRAGALPDHGQHDVGRSDESACCGRDSDSRGAHFRPLVG